MIFGVGYPVITSDDDAGATFNLYEIPFSLLTPDYEDRKEIENISPVNGERSFETIYTQMKFKIIVHLHLSDDPKAIFDTLAGLLNHDVKFKPHKYKQDGITLSNYLQKTATGDASFHCTNFEPSDGLNDILTIILKSKNPLIITDTIF